MTKAYQLLDLVDEAFFASRRQVGEGFVEKLIVVFGEEAPKLVAMLKQTHLSGNLPELAEMGHKLKGMCLNVGAQRLSGLGKEIEWAAKSSDEAQLKPLIDDLDQVLQSTLIAMGQMIQ